MAAQSGQTVAENAQGVQVAQHDCQQQRRATGHPWAGSSARRAAWLRRVRRAPTLHQIEGHSKGAHAGQGEQGGHNQGVGNGRLNAGEQHGRTDQHVAEVVIIEVTAGVPGIQRRETAAAQNSVEIGEIHGLFAAKILMPQVRVAHTHEQKAQEEQQQQGLNGEQAAPARAQPDAKSTPLPAQHERATRQQQDKQDCDSARAPQRQTSAATLPRPARRPAANRPGEQSNSRDRPDPGRAGIARAMRPDRSRPRPATSPPPRAVGRG